MFENFAGINWWGALAATVVVTVLAGLWFTVIVGKAHATAVGRNPGEPAP